MDFKQLMALVAVAEHGSFSAAARAIHTVQSNVSTHIARLETEVGAPLVDRSTGRLTDAGEAALHRARRIQHELASLTADVAALRDELSGTVRIGVIGSVARWLVPPLLDAVSNTHPGIRLVVIDATTTSLVPQLLEDTIDVTILNLPVTEPRVRSLPLFDEDRVLAVPLGHPLAEFDSVSVTQLAEHPLLVEPAGTAFRDELDDALAAAGTALTPLAEVDGMMLVAYLAIQGLGPAVLPASATPPFADSDGWRQVRIEGLPARTVGLSEHRSARRDAPTQAVVDVVSDVLDDIASTQPGIHRTTASEGSRH